MHTHIYNNVTCHMDTRLQLYATSSLDSTNYRAIASSADANTADFPSTFNTLHATSTDATSDATTDLTSDYTETDSTANHTGTDATTNFTGTKSNATHASKSCNSIPTCDTTKDEYRTTTDAIKPCRQPNYTKEVT